MSDMPNEFSLRGALLGCFMDFPQFDEDMDVLVREGYLVVTSPESCEWMKSKTSLAEYFKWIGWDAEWIIGGFWAPIEKAFGIKRHSLRKLAGHNANPLKPDESLDFKRIKPILQRHREQERAKKNLQRAFRHIKYLVLEAEDEEPETVLAVMQKIGALFVKNVDKKG